MAKNNNSAQQEDGKKKSGRLLGKLCGLIIILIIIAAILALLGHFGLGFDFGDGKGNGDGEVKKSVESVADVETTAPDDDIDYLELTVSGSSYIYRNSEYTLDDLIAELRTEEDIKVRIRDDNASKSAYDQLVEALSYNGITYDEEIE